MSRAAPKAVSVMGVALAGALGGPGAARAAIADGRIEVEGLVADAAGRPMAGADLVLVHLASRERLAAAADHGGAFHLPSVRPGVHHVVVFGRRGTLLAARVIELGAAPRSSLQVKGDVVSEPVALSPVAAGALGAAVRELPLRGRDLVALLEALPSGAPASDAGPGLLGAGQGDLSLTLDGFDLSNPVDGRVPLDLPVSLFADASAAAPSVESAGVEPSSAGVRLGSRPPARPAELEGTFLGSAGREGSRAVEREGDVLSADWPAPSLLAEVFAARETGAGRGSVSLAAAPRLDDRMVVREPSAGPPTQARRRHLLYPFLARGELRGRRSTISSVGLFTFAREERERLQRITSPDEVRLANRRSFSLLTRATARSGQTVAAFPLALQGWWHTAENYDGTVATVARRLAVTPTLDAAQDLWGVHRVEASLDVRYADATRDGLQPIRFSSGQANHAEASLRQGGLALHDRYRPFSWMQVDLGVRGEVLSTSGSNDSPDSQPTAVGFRPLLSPRIGVRLIAPTTGSGVVLAVGRYLRPPPLEPMLGAPGSRDEDLVAPHEDMALAGAELRRGPLGLSAVAIGRRAGAIVEDQIAPGLGTPAFGNPPEARRLYRALLVQATAAHGRHHASLSYTLASLEGNFSGYGEPELGHYLPASTPQFDLPAVSVNREGPLPLDRRHALRLTGHSLWRRRADTLEAAVLLRADSGAPLSALGRSMFAGPGEAFVAQRGSLGRTAWSASADARLTAARAYRRVRISLGLEAFNVTDFRPVVARDQIYTDETVVPQDGAGPGDLAAAAGPGGRLIKQSPHFGLPTRYAEPLLVRLFLGVEM